MKDTLINFIIGTQKFSSGNAITIAFSVLNFSSGDAGIISSIYLFICPLAFILMAIHFITGMARDASSGREITTDSMIKAAIWLIISDLLLSNIGTIMSSALGLSNWFGTQIHNMIVSPDAATAAAAAKNITTTKESLEAVSTFELIPAAFSSVIAAILSIIATAIILIVVYTAKIELMIRFCFAPVGFSGFADSENRNESMRYLKKLCASIVYCGAILLVLWIASTGSNSIMSSIQSEASTNMFLQLLQNIEVNIFMMVIPIAAVGSISAAKSAVNEAFGS
jgi:hypothetical protein